MQELTVLELSKIFKTCVWFVDSTATRPSEALLENP